MKDQPVIVITGASSGIGAALALKLGAKGHRLVLAARREKELQQVASSASNSAVAVVADLSKRDQAVRVRDVAVSSFGQVDVWINNAGRGITRSVLELTEAEFDEMMSANVKTALFGSQAIIPHFIEREEGHLINISSFLSRVPAATFRSAYSASKAALNSLTANLRFDLSLTHPQIHVSLVMPGIVANEFGNHALGGTPTRSFVRGVVPSQSSEDVADVIMALIEVPRAEVYTNPPLGDLARRYFADVAAFEENLRASARETKSWLSG